MNALWRKIGIGLVSAVMVSGCWGAASVGGLATVAQAAATGAAELQLVADQETAGVGGTASYHILYYNVENQAQQNVKVYVHVPQGLEAAASMLADAEWNAQAGTLSWNLGNVEANGVRVIHFQLNVQASVAVGTSIELSSWAEVNGQIKGEIPKLTLKTGSEIDQPFFQGYPDGKFHPERMITRAEVAAVVARVKYLTDDSALDKPYMDVRSDYWASGYINRASHTGYMSGYPDGTFHPDEPITRAELVKIVLSLRGVHEVPLIGFNDTQDHWAKQIIGTAKELQFIDGVGGSTFSPNGPTERQAAAKLFDIALLRGPLKDGVMAVEQHFPDVTKNDWAFSWVEESAKVAHEGVHTGTGGEQLVRYLPGQTQEM